MRPAQLVAGRYLAAVSVTCFLWDCLLSVGDEFEYVWKKRQWSMSRICFLWIRYTTIVGLVWQAFVTSGLHSALSEPMQGGIGRCVNIDYTRDGGDSCVHRSEIICPLGAEAIHPNTAVDGVLRHVPRTLVGVWAFVSIFDFATVILIIVNALHQPYRQRFEVIERIKRDGILSFLIVFGEYSSEIPLWQDALKLTRTYPIVGLKGGIGPDGSRPLRYEINKFANPAHNPYAKDQLNLFLLALERIHAMSPTERLSWFQICGIHGEPYADWDNSRGGVESAAAQWRGYCTHSSILFPTWHRLYCALVEQAVHECMLQVLGEFPPAEQARLKPAVDHWRYPYWDWALVDEAHRIKVPELLRTPRTPVQRPSGLIETIDNPLYRYNFPVNPVTGTIDGINDVIEDDNQIVPFSRAPYTVRHPEMYNPELPFETQTTWSKGISDNDGVEASINNGEGQRPGGSQLVDEVLRLFGTMRRYPPFSNTRWIGDGSVNNYKSLEGVHNNVHVFIGGMTYGHMSENEVAAFDPIFWMHHGNVERQLSIFQALNPSDHESWPNDPWISGTLEPWFTGRKQVDAQGTWTRPAGAEETTESPLTPFHKDTEGTVYDSDGCRYINQFGYAFEELQDWLPRYWTDRKFNEPLFCEDIIKSLIDKYGWVLPKLPILLISLTSIRASYP
ncbi:hypothetical protein NM688_g6533 [Phlebia brevispora]|uniref:Uncharacterized protein n=1 Tax=Phlebia brevispora TaxID=194682 RepID=A0ACC1SF13_9APHY|nr:hypothetical protein NM688_g6533 [Phlebia brevispora]